MTKGLYQLVLYMDKRTQIEIGKKGEYIFPKGYYIYTGSAMNNLQGRIKRHRRNRKKKFWHIDYLLPYCKILKVITYNQTLKKVETECQMNKRLLKKKGAEILVKGFGSSDCRCPAHLVYFKLSYPLGLLEK